VIVAGRGGGSLEDLWAFNEERVVRAIVQSRIPVVSAVGHEVDMTLADFAADHRAATPTQAAQIVAPSRDEIRAKLDGLSKHAAGRLRRELREREAKLIGLSNHHALRQPLHRIHNHRRDADELAECLMRGLGTWVHLRRRRIDRFEGILSAHSPSRALEGARDRLTALSHRSRRSVCEQVARARELTGTRGRLLASYDYRGVLRRGYALVWRDHGTHLVQRGQELSPAQEIEIQFEDARADAQVKRIRDSGAKEAS